MSGTALAPAAKHARCLSPIERRIAELFAATTDRRLTITDLCEHAFRLGGRPATPRQWQSVTRAALRLLRGAAEANRAAEAALEQVIAEAAASLGREPGGRGREVVYFVARGRWFHVDAPFAEAMAKTPSWSLWLAAWPKLERWPEAAYDWRATPLRTPSGDDGDDPVFHPADFPVRLWAAALRPAGVLWGEAEICRITEHRVHFRYPAGPGGEAGHLSRWKLSRSWALWRGVYFTSERSGRLAQYLEGLWFGWYRRERPGSSVPPSMAMPLAAAIVLLGVPANYTREDILAAFRREVKQAHPDRGGTPEQFRRLVEARDRLLSSIGTRAAATPQPTFAPKGVKRRYRPVRIGSRPPPIGHTRRIGYR